MSIGHLTNGDTVNDTDWNEIVDAVNLLRTDVDGLPPSVVAVYTPTLLDLLNSTSLISIVTIPIPGANAWADGDAIEVVVGSNDLNNSGGAANLTLGFTAGAGSNVSLGTAAWSDNATIFKSQRRYTFQRIGSTVWGSIGSASTAQIGSGNPMASSPANFTSGFNLVITAQSDVANALTYLKPQKAKVWHVKS
jgi:hypothetical protein